MTNLVTIIPYDHRWPADFAVIGANLRGTLGDLAQRIDHIGSTSVPGLAAKDRIDVQLTVSDFDRFDLVQAALERIGYTLVPANLSDHQRPGWDGLDEQWEKRFFRPPMGQRPTNLHVRAAAAPPAGDTEAGSLGALRQWAWAAAERGAADACARSDRCDGHKHDNEHSFGTTSLAGGLGARCASQRGARGAEPPRKLF